MCDKPEPLSVDAPGECCGRQDMLSLAFDQSAEGMVILDLGGDVLFANRAFAALHGYEVEDLAGTHISTFHEGEQSDVALAVRRQMFNAGTFDGEVHHVRRDGTTFPAMVQVTLVRDTSDRPKGLIATIRDITADKHATEALRISEGRFRNLLEALPNIAVQGYDVNGIVHYWNKASEDTYGYLAEEAVGRDIVELVLPPAMRDQGRAQIAEWARTGVGGAGGELLLLRKDGSRVPVYSSHIVLSGDDGRTELFCVDVDLRELKRAQRALELSHRFLDAANRNSEYGPLLAVVLEDVKEFAGCQAVGIRILGADGAIPYEAHVGFSDEFHELENPLSVKSDHCMCIDVIQGCLDASLSCATQGGSFHINGTTRFIGSMDEEQRCATRNICNAHGYESVALVPIKFEDRILGLIHLADPAEGKVPLETVETLEDVAMHLGTAIERARAKEALRKSLHEKEVLLREVHHRVKNNLQVISSILSIQATAATDAEAKGVLHDCRARVRAIAMVHERLSRFRDLSQIDLGRYVRTLAQEIFISAGMQDGRVTFIVEADDVDLDIDRAVPCGLILNELLANALSHAFAPGQGGQVRVGLTSDSEGLVLTVADDGIGLPVDVEAASAGSLGLKLVHSLARQLAGEVQIDRDGGTAFHVRFPHTVAVSK